METPDNLPEHNSEAEVCICPDCLKATEGHDPDWLISLAITGRFFGYPDCCIKAFLDQVQTTVTSQGIRAEAAYEGFIPCEEHAMQIIKSQYTHADLIQNRICTQPFPYPRHLENYVHTQIELYYRGLKAGFTDDLIAQTLRNVEENVRAQHPEEFDNFIAGKRSTPYPNDNIE
jgi:hypothetical protein